MAAILSMDNELFTQFMFYASLMLFKTTIMSLWTAKSRLVKNVHANQEDYLLKNTNTAVATDQDVERTRNAHWNDLENILPFVLIGLLYVLSGPGTFWATLHFQVFAGARIIHTLCYLNSLQPFRTISFIVAFIVNVSMLVQVLMSTLSV